MKMKKTSKVLAMALAVVMLIGILPLGAFATEVEYEPIKDDAYYKVISKKDWELAPGIHESEIIINNASGDRQQVMHVVGVDANNEYVKVIPSSKGMIPTPGQYGVQTMDLQAAYAEENGYGNVVAAMNISLSWYDSTYYDENPHLVGEPLGYLILDGVQYTNSKGQSSGAQTCLVINYDEKDGTPRPSDIPKTQIRSTSDPITGWEESVIPANFGFVVKDGKLVTTTEEHTSEGASRSMLGIKEDGSIVMVMNDGRQAPYSTGFNSYEMGEAMLSLGCVYAINGDGGGSSQFLSQRPGEDLELHCSPSDGALRATTHGVLVITTAPSTGEFVRASIETEHEYYTPGSTVQFDATGADLAGGAAEIPDEATWQLADPSMGTIDENGLFTSNGTVGTVEAQLVYNEKVVGSAEIQIVVPDYIGFESSAYTIPSGKSVDLVVEAKYDVFDVALKAADYEITIADETLGTLNGTTYTANDTNGNTTATVTLLANEDLSGTAAITIGKGSEVIFSFEEGTRGTDLSMWEIRDHEGKYTTWSDLSIVTDETGMVHNGEQALAMHMPMYTRVHGAEGYAGNSITWMGDAVTLKNATAIGMWIYIPEEAIQTEIALNYVWYNDSGVAQRTTPDLCLNDTFNGIESSGWYYLSVPVSKSLAYIKDEPALVASQGYKRNFFLKFYVTNSGNAGNESSYMGDITYYIDDITVDYSTAVDDRIAPVISATYAGNVDVPDDDRALTAGSIVALGSKNANFKAAVSDNIGIDASSAKVYVDGTELSASCRNGYIYSEDVTLCAGVHRVVYEIMDLMGNKATVVRYVSVSGNDAPIQVVPHKKDATVAYTSSVYSVDVIAPNAENVSEVTLKLDLDSMHEWELDHMDLAPGYTAEYYFENPADEDDNMVTVILTNEGSSATGETVLATLPARVWSYCGCESGASYTPAEAWDAGYIPPVSVNVEVEKGLVWYKDNTSETFSAEKMHLDTEAYIHKYKMPATYFEANNYHEHSEELMADKGATCTTGGYTDRTYCAVCDSVVDWGTNTNALGHNWAINEDGKLACVNNPEELYTGTWNGLEYVNGELNADGWKGESYYVNGEKLTGVHEIEGKYYNFGTDGICANKYPMSNEYWQNEDGEWLYMNAGVPVVGYIFLNPNPAFFDSVTGAAFHGEVEIGGEICVFEKGIFVESTTADVLLAGLAGDSAEFVLYADGTMKISGSGATYDYVSVGTGYRPNISWKNRPWGKTDGQLALEIKKVVVGKDITRIGDYTFGWCYNIEAIEFEKGSALESLGRQAFHYAQKVRSVVLPDSLTTIGYSALGYCSYLVDVQMPELATSIDSGMFTNHNSKLVLNVAEGSKAEEFAIKQNIPYETRKATYGPTDILPGETVVAQGTCGENATWILYSSGKMHVNGSGEISDYSSFKDTPWYELKDQITAVKIGKDITAVGKNAFAHCYNLAHIVFEEESSVARLGDYAFHYAKKVTSVVLPDSIKTIGYSALGYCAKLTKVQMPEMATSISAFTFWNDSAYLVLNVVEGTKAETFAKNNNFTYETRESAYGPGDILPGDTVVAEGTCGENATWTLYASGKMIVEGSGAISDYSNFKNTPWYDVKDQIKLVKIGKDITAVGKNAFAHCYNLQEIIFEEDSSVKSLGDHAFHYAKKVTSVVLPDGIETIGYSALGYCAKLTNVQMPELANSISAYAFWNDSSSLVLNVVEGSKAEAFAVKYGISYETRKTVYGPADVVPGETVVAEGTCGTNATWTLYASGKMVVDGSGAMDNYSSFKNTPWYDIKDQIKSVKIGKDITAVGQNAFAHCYAVQYIVFEEGSKVKSLGDHAFHYSKKVESVVLPDSIETIGYSALGYCSKLMSVQMPENAKSISGYAFWNDSSSLELSVVEGSAAEAFAVKYNFNYVTR